MPISVLVVDDSGFFRRRIQEIIDSNSAFKVIGTAANGREAVDKALSLKPDVITMDYEMPVMDGISAVREIMNQRPTPILMFSSLTYDGAKVTLDALAAGAVDFLLKSFESMSGESAAFRMRLFSRLSAVARKRKPAQSPSQAPSQSSSELAPREYSPAPKPLKPQTAPEAAPARPKRQAIKTDSQLVAIGTSTGGPVALQQILSELPKSFPVPIVMVQHMPGAFTKAFAERLNRSCAIEVREAADGDRLKPGLALLAPGGKQLMVRKGLVNVVESDERLHYRPSVDITFASAAKAYGAKVLGIVLTGMGNDGCDGAGMLKRSGSQIWAQDEESSLIYGMPMAIANANLADEVIGLSDFSRYLMKLTG